MDFHRSRPAGSVFHPGDKVECVRAEGTELTKGSIYQIDDVKDCPVCRGGVRLTTGPRPTDVLCGWWRANRFRPIKPPNDELTRRIMAARPRSAPSAPPTPTKTPELEDA